METKVRSEDVVNAEGQVAGGGGAVGGEGGVGVWAATTSLGHKVLLSLPLLKLSVAEKADHCEC